MLARFTTFTLSVIALCFLSACKRLTKSSASPATPLRAEVLLEHVTERDEEGRQSEWRHATVVFRDARGRAIEQPNVGVELNGVPMTARVRTGNYYDRHPYYVLRDDPRVLLAEGAEQRLTVVGPDGARRELGVVRMPESLDLSHFDFSLKRGGTEPLVLRWRGLREATDAVIYRSNYYRDAEGVLTFVEGSANDPAALRSTLGPRGFRGGDGEWRLPDELLAERPDRQLLALAVQLTVVNRGKLAPGFHPGSTLRAERRVVLRMQCADPH